MFFTFMVVLTFAAVSGTNEPDPTVYNNAISYTRAVCEVITLIVAAAFFISEVIEIGLSR